MRAIRKARRSNMKRVNPAGYVSLIGAATQQPVFGTKLTAASVAPVGGVPNLVKFAVTASGIFKKGDLVKLDPLNATVTEQLYVYAVPDGTHITLQGVQFAHASGVWIQLAIPCTGVYVQMNPGNTSGILIGKQGVVYTTGAYGIAFLEPNGAGVQPTEFTDPINGLANVMKTDDYWWDGGHTGDSILASCTVQ